MNFYFSISEFELLSLQKKHEAVSLHGIYISYKFRAGMGIYLFSYGNFFVEVWKPINKDKTEWIRVIDEKVLETYFPEINLQDLLPIS